MRLTNQSAATLKVPAGKDRLVVFDDDLPGFGLRISAGGSRQWVVQYRNAIGQTKRETLGRAGLLSATDARRAAGERLARAKLGEDPHAARAQERARAAVTFGQGVEPYLEAVESRLRPSSLSEACRYLRVVWKPLHRLPLHTIDRRKVSARLTEIARDAGPHAANRARAALSAHFAWLIGTGAADIVNPVIGVPKTAPETRRARVLTQAEMKQVLGACRNDDFGRIVRLLLLTGQRRDEVAAMRWSEVNLAGAVLELPAERTKNGLPHDVPLSRQAIEILSAAPQFEGRALVFGQGDGAFSGFSKAKAALDKRSGVKDWRLHDLRRTAATGMGDLGVLPHVVEAVLNHISGHRAGVAGIYNRALYATEKRDALDVWGRHLASLDPGVELAAADAGPALADLDQGRPAPIPAKAAKRRRRETELSCNVGKTDE